MELKCSHIYTIKQAIKERIFSLSFFSAARWALQSFHEIDAQIPTTKYMLLNHLLGTGHKQRRLKQGGKTSKGDLVHKLHDDKGRERGLKFAHFRTTSVMDDQRFRTLHRARYVDAK